MKIPALTLLAAVLVGACGSRTGLFAPDVACVFPDEASIVTLANDVSMAPADYVSRCHLTAEQGTAIVRGRRYTSAAQVDALPQLTAGTCDELIECAKLVKSQEPCTPNNHPTVVLELVVDESGSMIGDKWQALRDSLLALFADIALDKDDALRVGVVMFDDIATSKVKPAPLTDAGQLASLRAAVDKPEPHGGGTSTRKALTAAFDVVDKEPNVRRVVVLLSDGSPTGGDEEKEACVEITREENFSHGTQLFAVGIGPFPSNTPSLYDPAFMGSLAVAGATAPKGCAFDSENEAEICHYQVTPGSDPGKLQQSFGAALDAIRQSATTCP